MRVPVEPFATFEERYLAAANAGSFDMVHLSHVFFNTGFVADIGKIAAGITDPDSMIVVDGYHGFMAVPTSLETLQDRAFYLAGGYKYAQAGEGACFMVVPTHCPWDPYDVGWFGLFHALGTGLDFEQPLPLANGAEKFWGATFDPSGLYRFNAAMSVFDQEGLTVERMDTYIKGLQEYFLQQLAVNPLPWMKIEDLITPRDLSRAGHFLSFRVQRAGVYENALAERGVIVDSRFDFLRFGFGLYQDAAMVDRLFAQMREIW